MTRTKLKDRILPKYTKGEEIFNMTSHIVGAAFRNHCYGFMHHYGGNSWKCLWSG